MPEYRVRYEDIPWVVVISLVIVKTMYFFIFLPLKKISRWFRRHKIIKMIALVAAVCACVMVLIEIIIKYSHNISIIKEMFAFLGGLL